MLAVFIALSAPAFSADNLYDSGNAFARLCSSLDRANDSNLTILEKARNMNCMAYVDGVLDGVAYEYKIAQDNLATPFCIPDGVTSLQVGLITLKYIKNNPELANRTAVFLVVHAIREAFPCSEKH